jgi:hypothetical protein
MKKRTMKGRIKSKKRTMKGCTMKGRIKSKKRTMKGRTMKGGCNCNNTIKNPIQV